MTTTSCSLPRTNDAHLPRPPLLQALLRLSFGQSIINHSFHQEACFETSYVLILKAGLFEPSDILALHKCHPLLSHLLCACVHLRNDEANQETLSDDKAYAS